jgi:chain length determinant protein (polysaccharide antigen chain regulator)
MKSRPDTTQDTKLLTLQSSWLQLKNQWPVIGAATALGVLLSTAAFFAAKPRYEVKAFLDKPYANELTELNMGRTNASGLAQYSPEQVYAYFVRRLITDEAKQRFFRETYLPSLDSPPDSEEEKQALYNRMLKIVLNVTPPPEKPKGARDLYSVDVEARTGSKAAEWLQIFLAQVSEDARNALIKDIEQSIKLQVQNTERDLDEKKHTAELIRKDRQAQLTEALKVAQAVGLKDPQMTTAQPPRQDMAASFLDGSRLYARGSKSLQAELEILADRKDDTPFIDGFRQAQAQLNLLKELKPGEKNFKIFHIDGEVIAPLKQVYPKKSAFLSLGLFLGLAAGILLALIRSGLLQQLFKEPEEEPKDLPRRLEAVRK